MMQHVVMFCDLLGLHRTCVRLSHLTVVFARLLCVLWNVHRTFVQCSHCGYCCAQLLRDLPGFAQNVREPPFGYPYSVKARALLHAHFDRKKLPSKTLDPGTNFYPCTCTVLFYGHYTGQPALAGTLSSELEEFVEAWFYCPRALADGN